MKGGLNHCHFCGRLISKGEQLCGEHKIETHYDYSGDGREEERRSEQADRDHQFDGAKGR